MTRIAFLGLGAMGSRMAKSLKTGGYDVTGWNRSSHDWSSLESDGIHVESDLRLAVEGAGAIVSMLRDDQASKEVWFDGLFPVVAPGTLAIECSTISISQSASIAEAAASRGLRWVEAPLSGSLPQAEAQSLIFFAAGPAEAVDAAEPLLQAMGSKVLRFANPSDGAKVKLAVNALLGIQVAAMAEILAWGGRQGLNAGELLAAMGETSVLSPAAKINGAAMTEGRFAPLFPVELLAKDLGYFVEQSPVTAATLAVVQEAVLRGFGAENMTALAKIYRDGAY